MIRFTILLIPVVGFAAVVSADVSNVRQGPVAVSVSTETLTVRWPDEASRIWTAEFSLDTAKPLITRVGMEGRAVVRNASPQYWGGHW